MRFCGNCGARLLELSESGSNPGNGAATTITSPDSERLGVMIGADLKERLKLAGIEAAGQRRNVTVLFADLSGYTELSGKMDGEDLYDLVQEFMQLMLNDVYKYEGIVDKLTGDGLMALFGAPISHENNAERAVRAALDMQEDIVHLSHQVQKQMGVRLSLRIGLHSGRVIVGGVGSNLMMDYTAIGDTVNLAHRIEEAAPPGSILVSESVYRQTKALFDYQQVSALNPKGIGHPVTAFGVLRLKEKPGGMRGIEGLRSPMVGREAELQQLRKAITNLTNRKKGQFVFIVGEAGLGKSRLTAEFKKSIGRYPLRVLEGQSLAYRRTIPYWIFLDVLYSYLGLNPSAPQMKVRERLIQYTYQTMGTQAADVIPYFEHLLSLPYSEPGASERLRYLDAGQLRQQIFISIRDLLLAESQRRPILLILEDLHWSDEASLELLQFLIESLQQAPIFILAISRSIDAGTISKVVERGNKLLKENFHTITLQNLSINESERLLFQLITIPALPESLRTQILQRAAGVPFYLEEILRMLIDEGLIHYRDGRWEMVPEADISSLGVPETLQDLILARIDRLGDSQRRLLQVASVIGKNFSLPVLKKVLHNTSHESIERTLASLVDREFILPKDEANRNSVALEYTFRHILMSDAIYSTLLRRERRKLHGQVGAAIEELYANRLDGHVELLANHYRWSLHLDKALHYLILAGQKATRNHVNEQARQHFEVALELVPQVSHTPYQELQVNMGMGDVLVFAGEYPTAQKHYQQALDSISDETSGKYAEEFSTLFRKLARTHERQGDYDQALGFLEEAQSALDGAPSPKPVERAQIWNDVAWIHFRRGNFAEAEQLLLEALDLVRASDAYDAIASIYNRLGGVAYNQGEWDQAAGYLRKSIAIRESIGDVVGLATSFNNLGLLEVEMGEFDNALKNLTASYELKARLGQAEGIAMALNNVGWLRIQRGELREASQALYNALDLARQINYSSLLWEIQKNLGQLHLAEREWDRAIDALQETLGGLSELGAYDQLLDTYRLMGEAALGAGDLQAAMNWNGKVNELVDILESENQELSAVQHGELRRFQGMLAIHRGEWNTAANFLRESETIFQKLRSRLYQGKVSYQMGILAEVRREPRVARLRFKEAALLFQSVGAKLDAKLAEEAAVRQNP